jgi:DNA-3-methyladenine glycosylase I
MTTKGAHDDRTRCAWCGSDPLYRAYHDEQWGVPVRGERELFEMLVLEGAQAGLSWLTILRKREGYRRAFDGFDPEKVARYDERKIALLLADPGIVRNRLKVRAAVRNARGVLALRERPGGLAAFLWGFVGGAPLQNRWPALADIPARTGESDAMSAALRALGFGFVGPTVCYAFMQAVGMVNDHTTDCFRHAQVAKLDRA